MTPRLNWAPGLQVTLTEPGVANPDLKPRWCVQGGRCFKFCQTSSLPATMSVRHGEDKLTWCSASTEVLDPLVLRPLHIFPPSFSELCVHNGWSWPDTLAALFTSRPLKREQSTVSSESVFNAGLRWVTT